MTFKLYFQIQNFLLCEILSTTLTVYRRQTVKALVCEGNGHP